MGICDCAITLATVARGRLFIVLSSSVRPDWLKEDKTINSLPRATVANVIAQSQMTEAINGQIKMKEDKADKSKGGLRKDEDVKTITVKEGDDNTTNILHPQRFSLRPLLYPLSS